MATAPDPVELTRTLVAFNTINPPGDERPCAEYLGNMLDDGGFTVSYHEFATQMGCQDGPQGVACNGTDFVNYCSFLCMTRYGAQCAGFSFEDKGRSLPSISSSD